MAPYFDYAKFAKIFAGIETSYRFANPEKAAQKSSNPKAARNEYRTGLEKTAKGLIATFDTGNKDGRWNFDEFATKEADLIARMQYSFEKGIDVDSLSAAQRMEFESLRSQIKVMTVEENKQSFNVLDLNGDGFIDYKEQASEISLADVNDRTNQDGKIDATGFHTLYNDRVSPSKLKQELKINYDTMNLKKLGEPGDIK